MLSSLNAYGGLSAAELLTLFGANSSSSSTTSSPSSTSASTAQSASTGVSGFSANDPANAIKAILAQVQTASSGGGSAFSVTAQAAYATQMGDSSSLLSASVTVSSPGALQQIADAVSQINNTHIMTQTEVDPATHNGASFYGAPITVTANDAVNITIGNGAVSATAMQGAVFPNGLPSLTSIQRAYDMLKAEDQSTNWGGTFDGNFTIVALPPNALGAFGGNIATFGNSEFGPLQWALVLPQNNVSVTVSDTQIKG